MCARWVLTAASLSPRAAGISFVRNECLDCALFQASNRMVFGISSYATPDSPFPSPCHARVVFSTLAATCAGFEQINSSSGSLGWRAKFKLSSVCLRQARQCLSYVYIGQRTPVSLLKDSYHWWVAQSDSICMRHIDGCSL